MVRHPTEGESRATDENSQVAVSARPEGVGRTPCARPAASLGALMIAPRSISFVDRHVGPGAADIQVMLSAVGFPTLSSFLDAVVPDSIRWTTGLNLDAPRSEPELTAELRDIAGRNRVLTSFIGLGYTDCITPAVIRRNVVESPAWYTAYTPYQPEISQGRLEALLVFQTVIEDLTGRQSFG